MSTEPAFYNFRTLRAQLREAIDTAKSGRPVLIGAHGHPEVVMTAADSGRSPSRVIPPKRTDPVDTTVFTPHEVRTAESIDELLEDMKGEW